MSKSGRFISIMGILDLNTIKEALQISGKIEFYPQILEAQEKLLEQQKRIIDLESENRGLKDKLNLKRSLIHKGEVYYIKVGESDDGPFCTKCHDVDGKLVRLNKMHTELGKHRCPNCTQYYSPR